MNYTPRIISSIILIVIALPLFPAVAAVTVPQTTIVAVIDDGVRFSDRLPTEYRWVNEAEIPGNRVDDDRNGYVDDRYGWNVIERSADMRPRGSHGTDIATIVYRTYGAIDPDASGLRIMPIIAADASGTFAVDDINRGIRYAVDAGARIINLSLSGSNEYFSTKFNDSLQYAHDHDVLVVVAAGNALSATDRGLDLSRNRISPVCNDLSDNVVLGVGAATEDGAALPWSNVGRCVDVFAPGTFSIDGIPDARGVLQGTSFSAAYVSGIAAGLHTRQPSLSGSSLQDRIIGARRMLMNVGSIDPSSILTMDRTHVRTQVQPDKVLASVQQRSTLSPLKKAQPSKRRVITPSR